MNVFPTRSIALIMLSAGALLFAGCDTDSPDETGKYNRYQLVTTTGPDAYAPPQTLAGTVALIDGAQHRVWAAFEQLDSVEVADALVAAHERGLDVRVVADEDNRAQDGFQRLETVLDPIGLPGDEGALPYPGTIRYADGPTTQTPEPGTDLYRAGDLNRMTHNFVLVDETTVLNLTGGFEPGWEDAIQIGFLASSQDMARDFEDEFRQLSTGVDSTATSAFNGPVKAIADGRRLYPGNIADFELYFGPQERPAKRVLDHLYGARGSIWIATEDLSNEFLCNLLSYKLKAAFDVRIVLGSPIDTEVNHGGDLTDSCERLIATFEEDTPVTPGGVQSLRYDEDVRGTLVVIDREQGVFRDRSETLVYVMSQPLLNALTFASSKGGADDIPIPSDAYADANVWLIRENVAYDEPAVDRLAETFLSIFENAEESP